MKPFAAALAVSALVAFAPACTPQVAERASPSPSSSEPRKPGEPAGAPPSSPASPLTSASKPTSANTSASASTTGAGDMKPKIAVEHDEDYVVVAEAIKDFGEPYEDDRLTVSVTPVGAERMPAAGGVATEAGVQEDVAITQPVVVTVVDTLSGEIVAQETLAPRPEEPVVTVDPAHDVVTVRSPEPAVEVAVTVLTEDGDVETLTSSEGRVSLQPSGDGALVVAVESDGEILDVEATAENEEGEESDAVATFVRSQPPPRPGTALSALERRLTEIQDELAAKLEQRRALKQDRSERNRSLEGLKRERQEARTEAAQADVGLRIAALKSEIAGMRDQLRELADELKELRAELTTLLSAWRAAKAKDGKHER